MERSGLAGAVAGADPVGSGAEPVGSGTGPVPSGAGCVKPAEAVGSQPRMPSGLLAPIDGAGLGGSGWGTGSASSASTESSARWAVASNTSEQWPQRTQPSEIFSWSGTTRNIVPQEGQLVIRLMRRPFYGGGSERRRHQDPAVLFVAHLQLRVGGI